jgi:hypothetical protein
LIDLSNIAPRLITSLYTCPTRPNW